MVMLAAALLAIALLATLTVTALKKTRVSTLPEAESLVMECVGLPFDEVKSAFNNDDLWRELSWPPSLSEGRLPRPGHESSYWMFELNSSEAVYVAVEDGKVVGVGMN